MKNKWRLKTTETEAIIAQVVNTAALSSRGVANGRNVPVVILHPDEESKIDSLISVHSGIPNGNCKSQWGCTFNRNTIFLHLEFTNPIAAKIIIPFDTIKNGLTIDQIIYAQCLYLMTGESGTSFSQNLNKERILLEVPSREFANEWKRIFKKKYCSHLKKTLHISRKTAECVFDKMQFELNYVTKLRVK